MELLIRFDLNKLSKQWVKGWRSCLDFVRAVSCLQTDQVRGPGADMKREDIKNNK